VAVIAVAIGFPFTWFVSRLGHGAQVLWLVGLMCVLTLSEVLVAFAWQILLSRTIGISNLLVAVGLLDRAVSLQPSLGAVGVALVYLVLPYTFLLFYPPLSRLDRSLLEAATTMGAGPAKGFWTVILPVMRMPIIGAGILVFVYVLGAYVAPSQLGQPEHWTISVYITDEATTAFNLPFASAMAMVLLAVCLGLVIVTARLGRR
jgi:putative spermidine/putrescine transport system permease protein